MNAAIFYHPEAYSTSGPRLMGRNAAGESFLGGFLRYSHSSEFWVQSETRAHAEHFASAVRAAGRQEPVRAVVRETSGTLAALSHPGTLYVPGPGLGESARPRAWYGHASWSICGITHTTSSARAMDAITELLTAPVQPWDALICTSSAVKANVERVLHAQVEELQLRLGATRWVLPELPIIPLGIDTEAFAFGPALRQSARQELGLEPGTVAVLFMGRLSFHAKAHPLALYTALQQAARESGRAVVLLECGWHANDYIARAYGEAAAQACPDVKVLNLDGRSPEARRRAWSAADIFCSLSDNIQETFGITPIEAMAAGLPVVVSDWDGYKDTVRDGVDGWRIPTVMPAAGLGTDLALRHALEVDTYDMYCGHTSSLVAVDVQATAAALKRLMASESLRLEMGQAGRARARALFDWRVIIAQYEELWKRLADIRCASGPLLHKAAHPLASRLDPFHAFAHYATHTLSASTPLVRVDADPVRAIARVESSRALAMVFFAKAVLPTDEEVRLVLQAASSEPRSAGALLQEIEHARRPYVLRGLGWLLKLGVLALAS